MYRILSILAITLVVMPGQDLDMSLQDINPNSSSYNDLIGPSNFSNVINIYYFGHQY